MTDITPPRGYELTDHPEDDRRAIVYGLPGPRWHHRQHDRIGAHAAKPSVYAVPLPHIPADLAPLLPEDVIEKTDMFVSPYGMIEPPITLAIGAKLDEWWSNGLGDPSECYCRPVNTTTTNQERMTASEATLREYVPAKDLLNAQGEIDRLTRKHAEFYAEIVRLKSNRSCGHESAIFGEPLRETVGSKLGPDARDDWAPRRFTVEYDGSGEEFEMSADEAREWRKTHGN